MFATRRFCGVPLSETETVVEVTREDVEGVVSRWTGATIDAIRKSRPAESDGSKKKLP
jgi:hypothetical protein